MLTTNQAKSTKAWAPAVLQNAAEFGPLSLTCLEGAIPTGLQGSFYRNGPAALERGGQRVGHWFDGDGAILAIHFRDGGATGLYRYVQTSGYQAENQAGHFLYGNYGMLAPGPIWQRLSKALKNVANTSVLALPDKLLALWEPKPPHALNLETLATIGLDDLGGLGGMPYSAHPKRDPHTGDIFNFGVTVGAKSVVHVYRSDRTGTIQQRNAIPLSGFLFVHDFVLAGRYLVFCVPPVGLDLLPALTTLKSFSDAMRWQSEKSTRILIVDRDSLELVHQLEAEPWFQWHYANGYELPNGELVVEMARYSDFETNQRLKEVATGRIETPAIATLYHLRLDAKTGKVIANQQILNHSCEFPVVNPQEVGQPHRYTYLSTHSGTVDATAEIFTAIARYDTQTGTLVEANLGENRYPSEPIYAPDADNPNQGWILTVVYDGNTNTSEVWIYAADRLADAPVCRLALPSVVPHSFHGTWQPATR